jgi:pyrroloquinoline quinone biosynthesis protein D
MTEISLPGDTRPRLAAHVRLAFDKRRDRWMVQAPERVLVPDEIALEILRRCDGRSSLAQIIDGLAMEFDAPHDEIARDVTRLIDDLSARGILVR